MGIVELLLVLFAIGAIVSPFVTLSLLVKHRKLRDQVYADAEENSRLHAALQREVAELRRQVAASAQEAPATHEAIAPPAKSPAPVSPVVEKKPEPELEKRKQEPVRVFQPPVAIPPAPPIPQKPATPVLPTEPKPLVPAARTPPAEREPALPQQPPPQRAEPAVAHPTASVSPAPATPPQQGATVPSSAAARISTPSPVAALSVSAPKQTLQQRMKKVSAIEETLGTNWLNKLGIIILVVGVALFGIYELQALGALGKVGISYVAALALLAGGIFLEKRETYHLLGRTGIGGGWALLFFSTYAINHVSAMQVLNSEPVDLVLMLVVALAMAGHTLQYRSQFVTGLAFLLGYTTVALSHDNVYSLSAGVVLAIGLVAIVIKMGWFELEVFGILSSYLNHLYWLYRILGIHGAHGRHFEAYHASLAMLLFYWLIFRVSYVARPIKSETEEHVSTVAALLNTLLLLGIMKFQSVQPELAYIALLVIGFVELSFAQLPRTKSRREAFVVLSILGAALMITAVPFHYSGNNVAILWLVSTEVFLVAGLLAKELVFRRVGLLTGLLVGIHLASIDFPHLVRLRTTTEALALSAGVLFALCTVTFYGNVLSLGRRWAEFFEGALDTQLLTAHSYIGAFSAAAAVWAFLADDWTALGFASVMLVLAALGRRRGSMHLQAQYAVIGAVAMYRAVVVNLHVESPTHAHVKERLLTLPILGVAFYLTAKLAALRDDSKQRTFRGIFAFAGTVLFALLIWFEVPDLWRPLAFIAFAVALTEAGRALRYDSLTRHSHLVSVLALFTAITADGAGAHQWRTIPVHALGALPVVAGCYLLAKRIDFARAQHLKWSRAAYTWVGTALLAWVFEEALRAPWLAVGWIVLAVLLALCAKWVGYRQLAWQANAVAACALARTLLFNYDVEQKIWHGVSLRIVTVTLVAAGLYFISRKAAPEERFARAAAFLHSFAGTGLLTLLAWYEAPNGWLAALWAGFALVLAIVDRRFELEELPWQAHALALLTLIRSVTVNLYITATWHDVSVRLISLAIVSVVLYGLSRVIRMPESWRERDFHHIYSWSASAVVSLLLWYELQPLSVALGWGVFGLVLFEYGLLRNVGQLRYQAYVALIAAFARIFFANLTAGEAGVFWGPRMYTIAPLAVIFFFVYAQLPEKEQDVTRDRRLHFDVLLAYLGTVTIVALFYFQFPIEWVVTSWAALVFVLFGLALALERPLFLHQGLLLTVGTFARGMVHNLFGGGYFGEGDWRGRYFVLGSAVAILLASLIFAFRLSDRNEASSDAGGRVRILSFVVRRPEQLQFFAPIALLTFMLALKMRAGMVTVAWGIEGVLIVLLALALRERSYRLTGLGVLLLCVGKVMALDAWGLQPRDRYITFIIVGAALLVVSFLYSKHRETIRQFL